MAGAWFIQQAFFVLCGAPAACSAAPHGDNKYLFFSNSVLWVAAFTWKAKGGSSQKLCGGEGGGGSRCSSVSVTFSSKAAAFQLSWVWVSERSHVAFHGPPRSAHIAGNALPCEASLGTCTALGQIRTKTKAES